MDFSPTKLHLNQSLSPHECNPLQQWGYPDSEGYCSLSPASSIDSSGFSPPYQSCAFANEAYSSIHTAFTQMEKLKSKPQEISTKKDHRNRKVYDRERHSASEREKMRMRNLSSALQNLRRYLPPAVAPVGKTLTKIEILRLTIRYISHLSEVLGLDEETLIKRREEEMRRSNMCHIGLCYCHDRQHCSEAKPHASETVNSPYFSSSPRLFPEQNISETQQQEFQQPARWATEGKASDLGDHMKTFSSCALASQPIHSIETKDDLTIISPISPDQGFCQNFIDDMWDELQEKDLWTSFQPPETLQHLAY
ncbi:mesoderm posterior homolog A S homeolog [Xenopus laevis]|uniref:Mesoderm posterior homolog A S homeolog n=1 Tax=Xenopus laevis TaxID=8355 RepID=O73623_XENLA|nr:mesoderm posterior homolog A S homeolog [Xenopus laevis]AAI70095.1 Thylacine 1 [Xenopus laevis]AAI70101.1 Thylacine 1 [Xenopus laevis]CAA74798.1 thylacine 1 [Xenopus laevis]